MGGFLLLGGGGGQGGGIVPYPPKITIGYNKVSLEKLVRTPHEKQFDPMGPIASRGRIVLLSVKKTFTT